MAPVIDFVARTRKHIVCPICHRKQRMEQDTISKIWYPVLPYCCQIMRDGDSAEWNTLLDRLVGE